MLKFDPFIKKYPSVRNVVYGANGMVGSSNPYAAQAGLEILKKGGNAIDAAIATAATLTVVEPSGNGIGGDAFAIISFEGKLYGINGSGFAPELIDVKALQAKGATISLFGTDPITVPGIPKTWASLSAKFGRLPLAEVLKPAIFLARNGFAVAPTVARLFKRYNKIYGDALATTPALQSWFDTYCANGVPQVGDRIYLKNHAKTLELIGATNAKAFYEGEIADAIEAFMIKHGGYLRKSDLMKFDVEYVDPLSTNYRGFDVWQLPPNTQGVVVLEALNILENFKMTYKEDILTYHRQIEATKLAFVDGMKYIGDPQFVDVPVDILLSKEYALKRFNVIKEDCASIPVADEAPGGGTVYLATADSDGNMVSYIQSCYTGFGSGSVIEEYGISLHNRGAQFNLIDGHANIIAPLKRPYHTIIPGFLTQGNYHIGPFGVMGGPLQPQAHLQVVSSLIDFNLSPQDALDAPRWQWLKDDIIEVEPDFPSHLALGLLNLGHKIVYANEAIMYGRGQIIIRQKNGVYVGGTESRADGTLAAY
ncbi:MAG: gamma-glutamyltransferase family protein [Bacilli bacterium]